MSRGVGRRWGSYPALLWPQLQFGPPLAWELPYAASVAKKKKKEKKKILFIFKSSEIKKEGDILSKVVKEARGYRRLKVVIGVVHTLKVLAEVGMSVATGLVFFSVGTEC